MGSADISRLRQRWIIEGDDEFHFVAIFVFLSIYQRKSYYIVKVDCAKTDNRLLPCDKQLKQKLIGAYKKKEKSKAS